MSAYYNEIDPYCVEWLKALIAEGLIADGVVDSRPIQEVTPEELVEYTQCHFFAGLGGWSYAARIAGWPDGRQLWSGSCPCQPFSLAGKQQGFDDPRHLWPYFFPLIRTCRPSLVVGEQTASAAGYAWFDRVGADLESEDYAWRACDIPACSVNAPQIRNRLYWLGRTNTQRLPVSEREAVLRSRWRSEGGAAAEPSGAFAFWDEHRLIGPDHKGQYRRVKSGVRLLVNGLPARVPKLRALGNSIVPEAAAEVLIAYMESELEGIECC